MINQPICPRETVISKSHQVTPMLRENTFYCSCRCVFEVKEGHDAGLVLFLPEDFERISGLAVELPEFLEADELLQIAADIPAVNVNITFNVSGAKQE